MITKVVIRNLKRFEEQVFEDLGRLHLLVGQNNSGKSTILHALAIWNYCIEGFRASDRKGELAMEISLVDFTPLPLPNFT
jgi:AAA15 family ATPase/GTPase